MSAIAASQVGPVPNDPDSVLEHLYTHHWQDLVRYLRRRVFDAQAAEDIAQETMVRAWRHADTLRLDTRSIRRWLHVVARNIVLDRARHRRSRPFEVPVDLAGPAAVAAPDHSAAVVDAEYVAAALARLHPAHRDAIREVYLRDRTCAEAAAVLDVPVGTVKSRLHYGLRQLRILLEENA